MEMYSQRYYKPEINNNTTRFTHLTLEEEVVLVSSKIQDKDLRELYLYYYNQYIQPNAPIWSYPEGYAEFNEWYEEYYDDYETEALVKIVSDILLKTAGDIDTITYKNIQVKLRELKANKDFN